MIYSLTSTLPFGIHQGKTIKELLDEFNTYDYIVWYTEEVKDFRLDHEATVYARQKLCQHVARAMRTGELSSYDDWKVKRELKQFDDKSAVSHNETEQG